MAYTRCVIRPVGTVMRRPRIVTCTILHSLAVFAAGLAVLVDVLVDVSVEAGLLHHWRWEFTGVWKS